MTHLDANYLVDALVPGSAAEAKVLALLTAGETLRGQWGRIHTVDNGRLVSRTAAKRDGGIVAGGVGIDAD